MPAANDTDELIEGKSYDVSGTVFVYVTVTMEAPFTDDDAKTELQRAARSDGDAFDSEIDVMELLDD